MYKLMVVDDEPLTREYLRSNIPLLDPRWEVAAEAIDGQDAIEKLAHFNPDLILTDIKMPVMDGIELCRQLRERGSRVRIVLLSGYEEFEFAKSAMRYGVHEYLLKPLVNSELKAILHTIAGELECEKKQRHVLDTVMTLRESSDYESESLEQGDFIKILEELIDAFGEAKPEENMRENEIVLKVKNYIHFHFSEPLSLTDLSQKMNLSPSYLSSIFHQCVGEPYIKFLTHIRMEEACRLLRSTPTLKICEVASRVGYISDKHFISTFKSCYKMTPGEYQLRARQL